MDIRQRAELDALNSAIAEAGGVPCAGDDLAISEGEADQHEAAHWCAQCPVMHQCRSYGVAWPREQGVYGGLTARERRQIHNQNTKEGTAA